MDTSKLLQIIEDVQADEANFDLQGSIRRLVDAFIEGRADDVNKERETLKSSILDSILSSYVASDYHVLEELGIKPYLGLPSLDELEDILNGQAHEVRQRLEEFADKRQEVLNKLTATKSALNSFGLEPKVLTDDEYEVAFDLPNPYRDLGKFVGVVEDLKTFMEALSAATDEPQPLKITSVSNGSIHISIAAIKELAHNAEVIITHVLAICERIVVFNETRKLYKNFTTGRRKRMESASKEQKDSDIKAIVKDAVKQLKPKNPDDANRLTVLFRSMIRHFEKGVNLEVRTPRVEKPAEPSADASREDKQQYKALLSNYNEKTAIDQSNKQLFARQEEHFLESNRLLLADIVGDDEPSSADEEDETQTT